MGLVNDPTVYYVQTFITAVVLVIWKGRLDVHGSIFVTVNFHSEYSLSIHSEHSLGYFLIW